MAFKIGFMANHGDGNNTDTYPAGRAAVQARRSVVRVCFDERNTTLSYYNDRFDLHCGDIVYVDGKLEGLRGRVEEVNYNFKIKLSDYKRVVAVADTEVHGTFYMLGSHLVTFDRNTVPKEKIMTWYFPPQKDDDELVSDNDGESFPLNELSKMGISGAMAERGCEYYTKNAVRYICMDGTRGYALVQGSKMYEVEFNCDAGQISNLTCSCYCTGKCKHDFAVMLQLAEAVEAIENNYSSLYESTQYFAAIVKYELLDCALSGKEARSISL